MIINTADLDTLKLTPFQRDQVYNGFDCCVTFEVLQQIEPLLDPTTQRTYDFSRALQGPALEMRIRGVRVDQARVSRVLDNYYDLQDRISSQLERLVREGLGIPDFNPGSPADCQRVFYDALALPPVRKWKSVSGVTTDRNALEKLEQYLIARPILSHITALREINKKIGVLAQEIDPDGRIRTSYNIAGTTTGRWSSSATEFGTGGNLQNIEEALRSTLIADPGCKFAYLDGEQGESRLVGAKCYDLGLGSRYLDACESGDLHTTVAKLVWPGLHWPGDPVGDRALAEQPYYRHYDRRFMCKKIGHGTNYNGKPDTLATQSKVPITAVIEFQPIYFDAFPEIPEWHQWVDTTLRTVGHLTTLTERRRWFLGRRDDPATLREAIAYAPQGGLGDILNRGLLQVWRANTAQVMMQIHDAILIQYPEEREDEIIPLVLQQLRYPIELAHGRCFEIPYGVATGWNFGKYDQTENPDGLQKYRSGDQRTRQKEVGILDRPVRSMDSRARKPRSLASVGRHQPAWRSTRTASVDFPAE